MTVKLSSLKADLVRESVGDWVPYPQWPGVRFRVSSLNKPEYVTARDSLMQRLARTKSDAAVEFGRLYAEHILHEWDGLDEAYTPELAHHTLTNPEFREVVRAVEWCASRLAELNLEFVEKTGKNSAPPSGGG